ncbi:MAG: response regulator [Lawsonibacter sp.]
MFKTIIVEDDPMVSALNRRFVEKDDRFHVAAEFSSGNRALRWLLAHPVDLVLLDVYMPVLSGTELLRELRARGIEADAIMVTAAHDTQTLDELLKLGIVDYLVKPFTQLRFQQALDTFCRNRAALAGNDPVSQSEIDRLLHTKPVEANLPKGLQVTTMEKIHSVLQETEGETTCEVLASEAGLSAVTVRRYLTYLLENGEAESRINYDTGGRPSVVYHISGTGEQ